MNASAISISDEVDDATAKIVESGLDAFNRAHNGPDPTKPLWAVSRDEFGNIVGGLSGFIQWDWFIVAMLWVTEGHRGQGLGGRLLAEAEEAARLRGCTRSRLATTTFQAPGFYEKFGYVEVCRLLDVPPGHSFIWMTKAL